MAGLVALEIKNAWANSSTGTLGSDTTLTSTLGASVYQRVPEQSSFPYVHIADSTEIGDETFGDEGRECTITLHCWSDAPGDDECNLIANRVCELLNRATFSLTNFNQTYCLLEMVTEVPEERFRHIALRFRVRVSENA